MRYLLLLLGFVILSSCNLEGVIKTVSQPPATESGKMADSEPTKSSPVMLSKRIALVIGNAAYHDKPLVNPVNDANDMAAVLKKLGFDVILKTDANLQTMVEAVREFEQRLSNKNISLFYFSGHGNQYNGDNYLIPLQAKIDDEKDFQYAALSTRWILEKTKDKNKEGVNLVFLDACRSNLFGGKQFKSSGAGKGLTFIGAQKGSLIGYATSPGDTASDNAKEQNSIYTKHLLVALQEMPQKDIMTLLTKVRQRVSEETQEDQLPIEEFALMTTEFCLALEGCESTPPAVVATPVSEPESPKSSPITGSDQPGTVFQDTLKDGSLGPKMVWIPAGKFQMGDTQGTGNDSEKPVHWVEIAKPFAMGQYEITFNDYDKFCEATNREKPSDSGWGRGDRPVINIYWDDAVAYADWLSQQTGHTYRLPTEAEWEYAARAGTNTDYWWGNTIGKNQANCDGCGSPWDNKQTAPVGSFKANPFGLYDTVGNVWEWCQDVWHDNYQDAPADGSAWVTGEEQRWHVLRGGSWNYFTRHCRSAIRSRSYDQLNYNGFRVVVLR